MMLKDNEMLIKWLTQRHNQDCKNINFLDTKVTKIQKSNPDTVTIHDTEQLIYNKFAEIFQITNTVNEKLKRTFRATEHSEFFI